LKTINYFLKYPSVDLLGFQDHQNAIKGWLCPADIELCLNSFNKEDWPHEKNVLFDVHGSNGGLLRDGGFRPRQSRQTG
jgi:hypothetical protein